MFEVSVVLESWPMLRSGVGEQAVRGPKYIIIHTDDKTPTTHAHEKYNCKPGKKTTRTEKVHTRRDTLTYTYIYN